MDKARRNFFQAVLLILALLFTFTVRYLVSVRSAEASTSSLPDAGNITVAEVFSRMLD